MFFKGQIGTAVIRLSGELQLKLLILAWRSVLAGHAERVSSGASEAAATSEGAHKHWTPLFFRFFILGPVARTPKGADKAGSCGKDVPSGHLSARTTPSTPQKNPCDSYQLVVVYSATFTKIPIILLAFVCKLFGQWALVGNKISFV